MEIKQTLLKAPKDLHKEFKNYAYDNDMSIHDAILVLVKKGLEKA